MVKYYGRARQRIGSVNTNQIGLNMSGCPSKVGRQGYLSRYIGRRAQCNQKFCGPVYYHGVIWNYNSNLGRCVAKAPRGQSFNSGVGTKVGNPRFACNKTCSTDNSGFPWWYNNLEVLAAVNLLKSYFGSLGLNFVLVGEKETLASDVVPALPAGETIDHYEKGRPLYDTLPSIYLKRATDLINSINLELAVILDSGTVPMRHIVGAVTPQVAATLEADATPYGINVFFSPDVSLTAYASSSYMPPLAWKLSFLPSTKKWPKPYGNPEAGKCGGLVLPSSAGSFSVLFGASCQSPPACACCRGVIADWAPVFKAEVGNGTAATINSLAELSVASPIQGNWPSSPTFKGMVPVISYKIQADEEAWAGTQAAAGPNNTNLWAPDKMATLQEEFPGAGCGGGSVTGCSTWVGLWRRERDYQNDVLPAYYTSEYVYYVLDGQE